MELLLTQQIVLVKHTRLSFLFLKPILVYVGLFDYLPEYFLLAIQELLRADSKVSVTYLRPGYPLSLVRVKVWIRISRALFNVMSFVSTSLANISRLQFCNWFLKPSIGCWLVIGITIYISLS